MDWKWGQDTAPWGCLVFKIKLGVNTWHSLLQESMRSRLAEGFKNNSIFPGIMTKSSRVPLEQDPRSFPLPFVQTAPAWGCCRISVPFCLSSLAASPCSESCRRNSRSFQSWNPQTRPGKSPWMAQSQFSVPQSWSLDSLLCFALTLHFHSKILLTLLSWF